MSLLRLTLVLNASYEPINHVAAKRAIAMVLKGKAVSEELSGQTVKAGRMLFPIPSVIRLLKYRRIPVQNRSVSRKSIMLRDERTCQYCRVEYTTDKLTLDHVIPRSRGGESSFENLVACCHRCNNKKGARTPQEAGMPLLRAPQRFSAHAKNRLLARDNEIWARYCFVK